MSSFKSYLEGEGMAARQVARAEVTVAASPDEAFTLFTEDIGLWWRRDTPYWNDRERGVSVRIEPGVGGRFIEVYDVDTGFGMEVGRVTAWEPGRRLALTWTQLGWPQGASTEVEITFEPAIGGGTVVHLEHSGFERVPGALDFIAGYDAGWKEVLGWFAAHAGTNTS
ncbi:MAG TPA: SRPBCC domain-containing protein [Solirubrobacteraceae bacterium]|nr:SRPBCC domain-containing protein [Solirubrobacteraceae bacterium]